MDRIHERRLRDLPCEGVFAAARADQKYVHSPA
jgi:hypothetical protein